METDSGEALLGDSAGVNRIEYRVRERRRQAQRGWCSYMCDSDARALEIDDDFQGKSREAKSVAALEAIINERSSAMMFLELVSRPSWFHLYFEVLVFVVLFYYSDVILDILMLVEFVRNEDFKFFFCNLSGIIAANLMTLAETIQKAPDIKDGTTTILLIGFLLPFQLHVLLIAVLSLYRRERHPLLYTTKLAESLVESTVSAIVQTYAVIFRPKAFNLVTAWASVGLSFCSIGFAAACFDRADRGLEGLRGACKGWDFKFVLVLVFRICEVTSRITSLTLFQRVSRNELFFGVYGGSMVVALDVVVMVLLLVRYQGIKHGIWMNVFKGLPSCIILWNPLLEARCTHGAPTIVYFAVRFAELAGMGYVSFKVAHHRPTGTRGWEALQNELADAFIPVCAMGVSTALMYMLLPIIRFFFMRRVMMHYDQEAFGSALFDNVAKRLRDELLDYQQQPDTWYNAETFAWKHDNTEEQVEFHIHCTEVLEGSMLRLCNAISKVIDEDQGGKETAAEDLKASSKNSEGCCGRFVRGRLEAGLQVHLAKERQKLEAKMSTTEAFRKAVLCGANLAPFLKGRFLHTDCPLRYRRLAKRSKSSTCFLTQGHMKRQSELYRNYVEQLNKALRNTTVCTDNLVSSRLLPLRVLIPSWTRWNEVTEKTYPAELRLFKEKCLLVAKVIEYGWKLNGASFQEDCVEFYKAFDPFPRHQLRENLEQVFLQQDGMRTLLASGSMDTTDLAVFFEVVLDQIMAQQLYTLQTIWKAASALAADAVKVLQNVFDENGLRALVDGAHALSKLQARGSAITVTTEAAKQALLASLDADLRPGVEVTAQQQEELDKIGLYSLHEERRRIVEVGSENVREADQPAIAINRILKDAYPKEPVKVSFVATLEFAPLDAEARSATDQEPLLRLLATVSECDLKDVAMANMPQDAAAQLMSDYKEVKDGVFKQLTELLNNESTSHWGRFDQHVNPETADSVRRFKLKWDAGHRNAEQMRDAKKQNNEELDNFEQAHRHWTAFLQNAELGLSWSTELCAQIRRFKDESDQRIADLRTSVREFWGQREKELADTSDAAAREAKQKQESVAASYARQEDDLKKEKEELVKEKDQLEKDKEALEKDVEEREEQIRQKEKQRAEAARREMEKQNEIDALRAKLGDHESELRKIQRTMSAFSQGEWNDVVPADVQPISEEP